MGEPEGMVKTVFDAKTGELLGAHMIGAEVTELIQGYAIAKTLETHRGGADQHHLPAPHDLARRCTRPCLTPTGGSSTSSRHGGADGTTLVIDHRRGSVCATRRRRTGRTTRSSASRPGSA